jgi:hypothetical protein
MKVFAGSLFVWAALFILQPAMAVDVPITITVDARVKEQLAKMSSSERKTAEQAIDVGNKFIQQYFDRSAFDFDPGYEQWSRVTGPLMAIPGEEWERLYHAQWGRLRRIELEGGIAYEAREVCPTASLILVQRNDGGFTLRYRSIVIGWGISRTGGTMDGLDLRDAGEPYEVGIELNSNNRVAKLSPADGFPTAGYTVPVNYMREFIHRPQREGMETQAYVDAKVARFQAVIADMEQQGARVCK